MSRPLIGIPAQTLQAIDDIPAVLPHSWVMNSRYYIAAADMGAVLHVESPPAAGTSVIVSVPLLPGRYAGITAPALAAVRWMGQGVAGFRHAVSRRITLVRAAARRRRSRSART